MKNRSLLIVATLVTVSFLSIGASMDRAGNSGNADPQENKDHGIGPVKNVVLGPIDKKIADDGKSLFTAKCIICHEMDTKKIGPPLRNITKDRTPEYIMNLLVNAPQMQKEDLIVKDLFKKYNNVPMPDPAFTQTQARAVLEYLRTMAK
jgi:cytochrome c551/c552